MGLIWLIVGIVLAVLRSNRTVAEVETVVEMKTAGEVKMVKRHLIAP